MKVVFVLLSAFALLSGCASRTMVSLANRRVSSEEIHQAVRINQSRIHSMNGEGKFTIETPELAQTATFSLNLQKPDSVMLRIEGPFGIEVGAAIVTRNEFTFYNSLQNKVFSGPTNAENLNRVLRFNVTFEDLVQLFSGGAFFQDDATNDGEISLDDDHFLLTYSQGNANRKYWIDPSSLLITKVQHTDGDGKLVFEQRFGQHRPVGGAFIPHFLQLTQPKERRRVSIVYSELELNTPAPQFTLNIPGNAERIRIQ
jgi:outer membrane lipoprotein-sorting protein